MRGAIPLNDLPAVKSGAPSDGVYNLKTDLPFGDLIFPAIREVVFR